MHGLMRLLFIIGFLCALPTEITVAQMGGTIISSSASFARTNSSFDITPQANFTGVGTGDYLFETGWWFRVGGDTQETVFPVPSAENYSAGNASIITWNAPGSPLFSASEATSIDSTSAGTGIVRMELTINNLSMSALTIDLFHLIDLDVNGSAGGDNITQPVSGVPLLRIQDTTAGFSEYFGLGATAFQALPFAASTDIAAQLSNSTITNFDNSGVPASNIDVTAGMQWAGLVIPVGGTHTVTVYFTGNLPAPSSNNLFADGFE